MSTRRDGSPGQNGDVLVDGFWAPPPAKEKTDTSLATTLRTVAGMIAMGEKIEFGRDVDLMMRAAAEIERLAFYLDEWRADACMRGAYGTSEGEAPI